MKTTLTAVSLFASGGIGDLALRKAGVTTLVANEVVGERISIFKRNFPETLMIDGDIWKKSKEIIDAANSMLNGNDLDILVATPPCHPSTTAFSL